jgi:hypothetical protein
MTTLGMTASMRPSVRTLLSRRFRLGLVPPGIGMGVHLHLRQWDSAMLSATHRTPRSTAEHYALSDYQSLLFGFADLGLQNQGPLNHATGVRWVDRHSVPYVDALGRRTKFCLMLVESIWGEVTQSLMSNV